MASAQPRAPLAAYRIDLVNKDYRRRGFFRFIKLITHPACAYADIQLHEVRAGNR